MITNEKEFEERLRMLGALYEEGKDCLAKIYSPNPAQARLYEILREMRDMGAAQMQKVHWVNES